MKIRFIILFLLVICKSFSQDEFVCGTPENNYLPLPAKKKRTLPPNEPIDIGAPIVVNIFYNIVRDDNGNFPTGSFTISENSIQNSVKYLNKVYNPYKIYFKFMGSRNINSTFFTSLNVNSSHDLYNLYGSQDSINLFFVNNFTGWSGAIPSAYVHTPNNKAIFFTKGYVADTVNQEQKTIIHEMAHALNLKHIFQNYNNQYCERVTRDPSNPLYNANTMGDMIEDTPAQPQNPCCPPADNCATPFNITTQANYYNETYTNIIAGNFMSYTASCNLHFTTGQINWMRESVLGNLEYYGPVLNTVESLYMPYDKINVLGTVYSITDNGDGTAEVCRYLRYQNFKFQKGFDYIFPDNQPPNPTAVNTSTIPYIINPPLNCPVIIQQLGTNQFGQYPVVNVLTACRGIECNQENYVSGKLFSTQSLGSMNITEEELSKTELNDPDLYNKLMDQYYYILKKETESGAVDQKVFYKQ